MRKLWIWLAAGITMVALIAVGFSNREKDVVHAKETAQKLCGKVESIDGNTVVLVLGTIDGILEFAPSDEKIRIKVAENANILTMCGVKKTEATMEDMAAGDILAVTLSDDVADVVVAVVIHSALRSDESS